MREWRPRTAGVLSVLVGVSSAAAGFASGAAASPGSVPLAAAATKGISWTACGAELQCARVRVPLDWDRRGKRKIRLSVIRHLASRPEKRIGSMFVNPGGPGGSVQRSPSPRRLTYSVTRVSVPRAAPPTGPGGGSECDRAAVVRAGGQGPELGRLAAPLRDNEQWLALPTHYLFDAIPVAINT